MSHIFATRFGFERCTCDVTCNHSILSGPVQHVIFSNLTANTNITQYYFILQVMRLSISCPTVPPGAIQGEDRGIFHGFEPKMCPMGGEFDHRHLNIYLLIY